MSASDVARSQRVLDKIGARLGITDTGKQWLIAAVDPYHDTPVDCRGYPDVNEAASVVQVIKMSSTFSRPSNVPVGSNWDMHVHQFPWENPEGVTLGNYLSSNTPGQRGGNGPFLFGNSTSVPGGGHISSIAGFGGIAVSRVASGTVTFNTDDASIVNPFFSELRPYLSGEYRIIAKGFEVINTTSELNIQGLVTCYRQPCAAMDSAKATAVVDATILPTGYGLGWMDLLQTNFPPLKTQEALLLDGTKQWKAKDGCYVVPTLCSDEIPAGLNQTTPIMLLSVLDPVLAGGGTYGWGLAANSLNALPSNFQLTVSTGSTNTVVINPLSTGSAEFFNFNHAGAYFTGLSDVTTLTLNAIYYIERFRDYP